MRGFNRSSLSWSNILHTYVNEIILKVRKYKKVVVGVSLSREVEKTSLYITLNGVKLLEMDTESGMNGYLTHQELVDKALAFIADLRLAMGVTGNVFTFRQEEY